MKGHDGLSACRVTQGAGRRWGPLQFPVLISIYQFSTKAGGGGACPVELTDQIKKQHDMRSVDQKAT